jgi:hypothetical protein
MTDVANWSDPPAEFALAGSFAAGSCGTTRMPGRPVNCWQISAVIPGRAYTIEGSSFLQGALLRFDWRFDALSDHRTRLTQRIELHGENADTYIDRIRAAFEPHLEPGMQRIAQMMAKAAFKLVLRRDVSDRDG